MVSVNRISPCAANFRHAQNINFKGGKNASNSVNIQKQPVVKSYFPNALPLILRSKSAIRQAEDIRQKFSPIEKPDETYNVSYSDAQKEVNSAKANYAKLLESGKNKIEIENGSVGFSSLDDCIYEYNKKGRLVGIYTRDFDNENIIRIEKPNREYKPETPFYWNEDLHDVIDIKEDGTISYIESVPPYEGINQLGKRKAEHAYDFDKNGNMIGYKNDCIIGDEYESVVSAKEYAEYGKDGSQTLFINYNKGLTGEKADYALCYSPENTLLTADKGQERYIRIDGSTVCSADEHFVYSNKTNNSVLSVYNKEYYSETKDNKISEIAKKSIIFGENNKQITGVSVKKYV